MGLIESSNRKAQERQQESLIKEAAQAGFGLVKQQTHSAEGFSAAESVGSALTSLFGGRHKTSAIQALEFDFEGVRTGYFQPYSGTSVLPGEHHVLLRGALRTPAALIRGGMLSGPKWTCGSDQELANWLNTGNPQLAQPSSRVKFDWGVGASVIEHSWAVQICSTGSLSSLLSFQPARYGGILTYQVGFDLFAQFIRAFTQSLPQAAEPVGAGLYPCAFAGWFLEATGQGTNQAPPSPVEGGAGIHIEPISLDQPAPAATANFNYSEEIPRLIRSFVGRKIYGTEVPQKKLDNIRRHVLPPEMYDDPVLAAFDITAFGACKDAIVLTPTHIVGKSFDDRLRYRLDDISGVIGPKGLDKVLITVEGLGEVHLICGGHVEKVASFLTALLSARQGA